MLEPRIKETLGPVVLSTIERLSSSQRSKNVLFLWKMINFLRSYLLEGPLSEVSLLISWCVLCILGWLSGNVYTNKMPFHIQSQNTHFNREITSACVYIIPLTTNLNKNKGYVCLHKSRYRYLAITTCCTTQAILAAYLDWHLLLFYHRYSSRVAIWTAVTTTNSQL